MNTEKTSLEKENQPSCLGAVSSRFIFGLVGTLFISVSVGWFAFWLGIEFHDYKWIWSENNAVLAGQYLLNALWGIAFCTSPLWWLGATMLSAKMLFTKI